MGKPSIFSREYEKKMKRRRRNTIIISLSVVLVIAIILVNFISNPIDYTNIKKNIQAWIDSDTINNVSEKTEVEDKKEEEAEDKEVIKKEPQKAAEEYIDITLVSGNVAKGVYVDDNRGGKVFETLNTADKGVSFNIDSSGKQMIVTDTNSVITLFNVDGTNKIVSKDQYVSTNGGVFTKEATMQTQPGYLWNSNPKFVNEGKIIFVTNRPYFGSSAVKQYLWMTDIQTNEDRIFWELAGLNIQIGEKEEKGIKVTVDGNVYYIDVNGNCIQ